MVHSPHYSEPCPSLVTSHSTGSHSQISRGGQYWNLTTSHVAGGGHYCNLTSPCRQRWALLQPNQGQQDFTPKITIYSLSGLWFTVEWVQRTHGSWTSWSQNFRLSFVRNKILLLPLEQMCPAWKCSTRNTYFFTTATAVAAVGILL